MKVLIISHGHPDDSPGGAELAAYNLFTELKKCTDVEAHFLSIQPKSVYPQSGRPSKSDTFNEHSLRSNSDPFDYTNQNPKQCWNQLKSALRWIKPDVVHLHHFLHLGIDSIQTIKHIAPEIKICLTLHDYRALCLNDGLMITRDQHQLCSESSPENCHQCMPSRSQDDIKQRHQFFRKALKLCDAVISPSQFLAEQFKNNGINHHCVRLIGNGLLQSRQVLKPSQALNRFGFFGKTTEAKGLLVFLRAIWRLQGLTEDAFKIEIFGDGLEKQPAAFQYRTANLLEGEISKVIQWHGRYNQNNLQSLMECIDWVVMPSIWWENAPLVIQEAFAFQRPVIGSGIGGILESIRHRGGLSFHAGDDHDLAKVMKNAIGNHTLHQRLRESIQPPLDSLQCAIEHTNLYAELLAKNA